jgi:hypothetical protein
MTNVILSLDPNVTTQEKEEVAGLRLFVLMICSWKKNGGKEISWLLKADRPNLH